MGQVFGVEFKLSRDGVEYGVQVLQIWTRIAYFYDIVLSPNR